MQWCQLCLFPFGFLPFIGDWFLAILIFWTWTWSCRYLFLEWWESEDIPGKRRWIRGPEGGGEAHTNKTNEEKIPHPEMKNCNLFPRALKLLDVNYHQFLFFHESWLEMSDIVCAELLIYCGIKDLQWAAWRCAFMKK